MIFVNNQFRTLLFMWIPQNEQDIITATTNGSLEETITFDAKREISSKNVDLAKDVSAMANTSGGSIVFGIGEDSNKRLTILAPFELKGQREKIDQVIQTSISEIPLFKLFAIESQADSTKGYIVLVIPPSERAPHMVEVRGEKRFYGRSETGNRTLSEAEVARLYERRNISQTSILPILEEHIKESPIKEHNGFGHLHVVIKPVLQDESIFEKALSSGQNYNQLLNTTIAKIIESNIFGKDYEPNFLVRNWVRNSEGFLSKMCEPTADNFERLALYLEANFDGSGSMFCNRAAETFTRGDIENKYFFSDIVAGNTIKFLAFFGKIYKKASYLGVVDIGVGLTGLENSIEDNVRNNIFGGNHRYTKSTYQRTKRVSAMLLDEKPKEVASELLLRLIDGVSQGKYNPFTAK